MPNPASVFPAAPPIYVDRGSGAKLLQPANLVTAIVAPVDLATSIVAINAIRQALKDAGITA